MTARFPYLDYADPNLPLGQLDGAELGQTTFGVNWYLADRLWLIFNYSYAVPVEPNTDSNGRAYSQPDSRCIGSFGPTRRLSRQKSM